MSQEEWDWLEWLKRRMEKSRTAGGRQDGVTDRWVRSSWGKCKPSADGVLVHGLRRRASNRRIDEKIQARAMKFCNSRRGAISGRPLPASSWPNGTRSSQVRGRMSQPFCGKVGREVSPTCMAGGRDGVAMASWCSGTRRITIGGYLSAADRRGHQPELGAFCAARRDGENMRCVVGIPWSGAAGWWIPVQTAIRCSALRRDREKPHSSGVRWTGWWQSAG